MNRSAVRLPPRHRSTSDALSGIWAVSLTSALLAGLYFGREVLIPLALAALITFLLTPLASWFERWLGRIGSVLMVMLMVFCGTLMVGWTLGSQTLDLARQLPSYKDNIRAKLQSFHVPSGGAFSKLSETVEELKRDLPGAKENDASSGKKSADPAPLPVEIVEDSSVNPMETIRSFAAPVLGPLGTGALVFLLATFMLLKREDLQSRLIRLIGQGRISATTRVMDEAGTRVRRYLLMQVVVNVTYGIPLAIGLYFIGVPNAILWGALAAGLRFVPYIGPWIAAVFPVVLSLAVSPTWVAPLLTLGLFVVLELISNNVLEPWIYGTSTGVSPFALIVSAVFWTWLWGPAGLVMATPFTVCLVVMGRHIPRLSFLSVVLGEEEALTPAEDFYHRLLKQGEHDETELAEGFLKTKSLAELYDAVLIPVVLAVEEDHRLDSIDDDQHGRLSKAMKELVNDLGERHVESLDAEPEKANHAAYFVQCLAAKAERDELVGAMAVHILRQQGYGAANVPATQVASGWLSTLQREAPDLVCVSVVAPTKAVHARYLCQRIRRALPDQRIVVGLWGREEDTEDTKDDVRMLREAGAEEVFTNIADLTAYAGRAALRLADLTEPQQRADDAEERR